MGCTNDTWQFEFWRQEAQKIYVLFLKNAKFLTFPVLKIDKKIKISKNHQKITSNVHVTHELGWKLSGARM